MTEDGMLRLRSVTGGYGRTTVVRDVSIDVPEASVVAILGPNGAGKTTTLRIASGLLPCQRGQVYLNGADVTGLSAAQRAGRGLCHVPEGRGIFRGLTVRENLVLFTPPHRAGGAVDPFTIFPVLRKREDQLAGSLSGGQQQMLALSRAYLSGARVVLLDELSMGLAPTVVSEIFDSLQILTAHGVSLVMVEQYVNRALAMASVVYVLRQGAVVYSGDADALDSEQLTASYLQGDKS